MIRNGWQRMVLTSLLASLSTLVLCPHVQQLLLSKPENGCVGNVELREAESTPWVGVMFGVGVLCIRLCNRMRERHFFFFSEL